jgi:hypothetical protein
MSIILAILFSTFQMIIVCVICLCFENFNDSSNQNGALSWTTYTFKKAQLTKNYKGFPWNSISKNHEGSPFNFINASYDLHISFSIQA